MSDKSSIEWTDATPVYDKKSGRTRYYKRLDMSKPGQQIRRRMALEGKKWCSGCNNWLPENLVTKNGLCRPHANEAYRLNYSNGGNKAIRQRVHARKRGIDPVPVIAQEYLMDQFGGLCAYCKISIATTWDHIFPVANGGETVPGNIVPTCMSCNSSKKKSDVWEWAARKGFDFPHEVLDVAILMEVL